MVHRHSSQRTAMLSVHQRVVDERARRDHSCHGPLNHTLGLRSILDLIGHSDTKASIDQPPQVRLELMVGDARQWHAVLALGQRQTKCLSDHLGIVVERLVEVADAK